MAVFLILKVSKFIFYFRNRTIFSINVRFLHVKIDIRLLCFHLRASIFAISNVRRLFFRFVTNRQKNTSHLFPSNFVSHFFNVK